MQLYSYFVLRYNKLPHFYTYGTEINLFTFFFFVVLAVVYENIQYRLGMFPNKSENVMCLESGL